jgi:tRNA A-37 threonylcarbamoyl transferase component Bud32/Leucine-rich repeat (LRR) protein
MAELSLTHPDRGELRAFSLGKLDDAAASAWITTHLETCVDCLHTLETIAGDELEQLVRGTEVVAVAFANVPDPAAFADHPRYQVLDLLGAGGMGAVYRARHKVMDRDVALKVIHPRILEKPSAVARFRHEVQAAARLCHPNIVTAYDADQVGNIHFLVMEFVAGQDMARVITECGPLPVAQAADYVRQVALGLQHAHEQNMVHRDIKPANVMVTKARGAPLVKILDFGLAHVTRELAPHGSITDVGTVMGTPDFMAPEQADDARLADIRADIYSLGCTFYYLLTGHPPFPNGTVVQKIKAHQSQVPTPVTELRADVPPELARVIERMMAKERGQRYQAPAEAAQALTEFLQGATLPGYAPQPLAKVQSSRSEGPRTISLPNAPGPGRRHGLRLLVAAAVLLAVVPMGYFFGGTILRFATNQGELIVQIEDKNVEVKIVQNGIVIQDKTAKREFTLTAGPGEIEVLETDGIKLTTKWFELSRGGRTRVMVALEELADRRAAQCILRLGGKVRVNDEDRDIRAVAELPQVPFRLTYLELFHNPIVTDGGLAPCEGCKNLKHLRLWYVPSVTGAALAYFKDCKDLTHLEIPGTQASDAGLAHFKDCKNLINVTLDDDRVKKMQVTDVGLAHFKDCRNLSVLRLTFLPVTDTGMANLEQCRNLTILYLSGTQVTDEGLAYFRECEKLEQLLLSATKVTDAGLAHFKDCKNLMALELQDTQVSDKGLVYFKDCTKLLGLRLDHTEAGDAGMAHFKDCKNMKELFLTGTQVGDAGLAYFKNCENLSLVLLSGTQVSDMGLANLRNSANLERLFLAGTKVSDTGLACLKNCRNLTHLDLVGTQVSDAGIPVLAGFSHLVELKVASTRITVQGYRKLKASLPRCQITWP